MFCGNNPVNFRDPSGLVVQDPQDAGLGFTTADVIRSIRAAQEAGIRPPHGLSSWSAFWNELTTSPYEIEWYKGDDDCVAGTKVGSKKSTITIPANARPGVENMRASNTENLFYFESTIVHELVHAYQGMTGMDVRVGTRYIWYGDDDKNAEWEPTRVGNDVEAYLGGSGR